MSLSKLGNEFVESVMLKTIQQLANNPTFKKANMTEEYLLKEIGMLHLLNKTPVIQTLPSVPRISSGSTRKRRSGPYEGDHREGYCCVQFHGKNGRLHKNEGLWCPNKAQPKNWSRLYDLREKGRITDDQWSAIHQSGAKEKIQSACGNHKLSVIDAAISPSKKVSSPTIPKVSNSPIAKVPPVPSPSKPGPKLVVPKPLVPKTIPKELEWEELEQEEEGTKYIAKISTGETILRSEEGELHYIVEQDGKNMKAINKLYNEKTGEIINV